MVAPRLVLCNGGCLPDGEVMRSDAVELSLRSFGPRANVHLRIEDVTDRFGRTLPSRVVDLLELAAFVYSADCAVARGKGWSDRKSTEPWTRQYRMVVPVRDVDFWSQQSVRESLSDLLGFMTDDRWTFDFVEMKERPPIQGYLELQDASWPFDRAERVIMFSGGLDSLAGAVLSACSGERSVLVSHRSVSTMDNRQRLLFEQLQARYPGQQLRIPVWVNKSRLDAEPSQRTRSFLFGSLGAAVSVAVGASAVTFYENGIVSLNLPVADEVLRSRASRTTHPIALQGMSDLVSQVAGREIRMENPFIFMTKTDVVSTILEHGAGELIGHSCSCASHTFFKSKQQAHCGTCSQCIDRRIAVVAAGAQDFDCAEDYAVDVFAGPRNEGYERAIAVDYARHAVNLATMSPQDMARQFNLEISRATRVFPLQREAAEKLIDMHSRHGVAAYGVLQHQIQEHAADLLGGGLPETSMLRMIAGGLHRQESWRRYAERLAGLLGEGLPRIFQTEHPDNEVRLQEASDGILVAAGEVLNREYPFLRWGSVLAKPDWSDVEHELLVEAKYIKKKEYVRRITEEIAADITKYGDSGNRVMFFVYDPLGFLVDADELVASIESHSGMMAFVIR